ncbi:251_t:CDS:2 [Acaulospora morrowiae]|uniref:251_t:CDS:1 n=1 Tax=Acaulospora morrowiae TaxID=94023 RepID=A0A9N9I1G1_9GLOM|nr:251_t:CDS:2 [Acaulospora morrowiae]
MWDDAISKRELDQFNSRNHESAHEKINLIMIYLRSENAAAANERPLNEIQRESFVHQVIGARIGKGLTMWTSCRMAPRVKANLDHIVATCLQEDEMK